MQTQHLMLAGGLAHGAVLCAAAITPSQLRWRETYANLPKLHRQLIWVYGGFIFLCIASFGLISVLNAQALVDGSKLSRSFCLFVAVFWSIRLALQGVFDVKEHLRTPWHKLGYHALTLVFIVLVCIYGWFAITSSA